MAIWVPAEKPNMGASTQKARERKIKTKNITDAFPAYKGAQTYEAASQYIQDEFLDQNQQSSKDVYPHVTCALDTSNIKHVFAAVRSIILRKAFTDLGI